MDARGGVAVTFALMLTVLCGFTALVVDYNRTVTVARRLEQALDSAALAGAKMLDQDQVTDADITLRVTNFFKVQAPAFGIPLDLLATLQVTIDRTNNAVTASAAGNLKTTFAKIIGFSSLPVSKSATVVYKMRDVELALVLDTTGSMGDVPAGDTMPKIESLKVAANTVVDTLYAQAVNDRGIRIAIAPFSSSVNAGSYGESALAAPTWIWSWNGGNATGCAVERLGSDNADDAAPYGSDRLRDLASVASNGNACPTASIMPLMGRSQKSNIEQTISSFSPGGSTAGHIGAAWGWYMLSPNWNGIFTGNSAPSSYSDANVTKHLVLMTDGLFNTSYLSGLPAGSSAATTESYAQFDALCAGMKVKGITVYTIGFGLNDPTAAAQLSGCASSTANFFPVATGTELQAAFGVIVAKLNQLRVSR